MLRLRRYGKRGVPTHERRKLAINRRRSELGAGSRPMNQVGARWWNSYEGKPRTNAVRAGRIKYLAQCDLKEKGCRRRAVLQIECLNTWASRSGAKTSARRMPSRSSPKRKRSELQFSAIRADVRGADGRTILSGSFRARPAPSIASRIASPAYRRCRRTPNPFSSRRGSKAESAGSKRLFGMLNQRPVSI